MSDHAPVAFQLLLQLRYVPTATVPSAKEIKSTEQSYQLMLFTLTLICTVMTEFRDSLINYSYFKNKKKIRERPVSHDSGKSYV